MSCVKFVLVLSLGAVLTGCGYMWRTIPPGFRPRVRGAVAGGRGGNLANWETGILGTCAESARGRVILFISSRAIDEHQRMPIWMAGRYLYRPATNKSGVSVSPGAYWWVK